MRPPKLPRPWPVPRVRSRLIEGLDAEDPAAVAAFWRTMTRLPLVETDPEDPGHAVVTFCWRDETAAEVLLFANRLTDETRLADTLLERLGDSDLWHASFRMPADWRASYAFLVRRPGEPAPWRTAEGHAALRVALDRGYADPANPDTCRNRAGVVQSVVALPRAPEQPWLARRPDVPRGAVSRHDGSEGRTVWLYDPPGVPASEALPLVLALDGEVWTGPHSLPTTLDNLLADGATPPLRAALLASGGRERRWADLGAGGEGAAYLAERLVPWVAARRALCAEPASRIVVGQSLGGLTALRAALTRPDVIGTVLCQSASLWQDDLAGPIGRFARSAGSAPGMPVGPRVHLCWGTQEWVLTGPHRELADRLRRAGVEVATVGYTGGHDYAWWRGAVADGLHWACGDARASRSRG